MKQPKPVNTVPHDLQDVTRQFLDKQAKAMALRQSASQQSKTEAHQSTIEFNRKLREYYMHQALKREHDLIEGHKTKIGNQHLPQHLKARLDEIHAILGTRS